MVGIYSKNRVSIFYDKLPSSNPEDCGYVNATSIENLMRAKRLSIPQPQKHVHLAGP